MFGSLPERVVELGLPLRSAAAEGVECVLLFLFPRTGTRPITASVLVGIPPDALGVGFPIIQDVYAVRVHVDNPVMIAFRAGHIVASLERVSAHGIT